MLTHHSGVKSIQILKNWFIFLLILSLLSADVTFIIMAKQIELFGNQNLSSS